HINRTDLERASSSFDVRYRIAGYAIWDIPAVTSHKAFRGWRLASTTEFQTGQPFTVNTVVDRNLDGNLTDRLNRTDGFQFASHTARPIQIKSGVSALDLIAPARNQGLVGRNTFRADGIASIDLAVTRKVALSETKSLDFRVE